MNLLKQLKEKHLIIYYAGIILVIFPLVYLYIINNNIESDLQLHAQGCVDVANGKNQYTGTFLMYWLVNLLSLFSGNYQYALYSLIGLIMIGLLWKYLLIFKEIQGILSDQITFIASLCAIFYFGIPLLFFVHDKYYLMSNQTPNLFHNSSSILVYPLSYLLFHYQIKFWNGTGENNFIKMLLIILISALIKPSFLLAFLIVTPLMTLFLHGFSLKTFRFYLPLGFIILIIICQSIIIYYYQIGRLLNQESHVTISYLDFWSILYPKLYYPVSLAGGFMFPGIFILLTLLEKKSFAFYYAFLLVIASILIFVFFSETGPRRFHGNFSWQVSLSYYVLLIVILKEWFGYIRNHQISMWKNAILGFVLALHGISGIIYLYRFLVLGDYG
jgi:hypothetical protein